MILLVSSKLPFAAKGSNAFMVSGAVILSIGLFPIIGKIWFSKLRHRLIDVVAANLVFLISNQCEAVIRNVLLALNLSSACWSVRYSCGSMFWTSNSFNSLRLFLAFAAIKKDIALGLDFFVSC